MQICQYKMEVFTKEEPFVVLQNCPSKMTIRDLELIHGEHEALNKKFALCESHYRDVFGDMIYEETRADRDRKNERFHFKQNVKMALAQNETITYELYKENNYGRVQRAIDKWNRIRFHICRYEYCSNTINKKNIFKILIMNPFTKEVAEKYYFCSYQCWYKLLLRMGIEKIKGKGKVITIDHFFYKENMK